jgi:hypothetical protein
MHWFEQLKPALIPFLGAAAMALCLYLCRMLLPQGLPLYFRTAVLLLLGCAIYIGFIFIFDRASLARWLHYFAIIKQKRL